MKATAVFTPGQLWPDNNGVHIKKDAFTFMADRWRPENAIDGRYVWLPVQFDQSGKPLLAWLDQWDLDFFNQH